MKSLAGRFAKLAALVCLGAASLGAGALELRGFRGIAWGDGADTLGSAALAHADGDVACFKREHENMLFGDSPLNDVRYCFHQDHLFMVTLDSAVSLKALISEFQRAYGPPVARLPHAASWGSAASSARAELVSLPTGGSPSRLTIYSNRFAPQWAKSGRADMPHRVAAAL
jgi:hypothetical protein